MLRAALLLIAFADTDTASMSIREIINFFIFLVFMFLCLIFVLLRFFIFHAANIDNILEIKK